MCALPYFNYSLINWNLKIYFLCVKQIHIQGHIEAYYLHTQIECVIGAIIDHMYSKIRMKYIVKRFQKNEEGWWGEERVLSMVTQTKTLQKVVKTHIS